MARKGRYTKKAKLGPGCQQPHTAPSPASAAHDSEMRPDSSDSVPATARPFIPPRSVPRPAPQTSTTNIQNSEPGHVNLAANANNVDSLDQQADDPVINSSAQRRKRRKTTEFWAVKIIDSDGTIKPTRLSVREAMERPNGRKIVLRFNRAKQAIRDEAGLLSGVLGLLETDYGKFPICERSWRKITTKDKQIFHFDEDIEGTIKKNILKSMGKSWKERRLRLYDTFYEPTLTTEENIEQRPPGIDREHWRWFLNYRAEEETKEKCKKNAANRSKQLYTHTGGSKSFARRMEEESEEQGRSIGRGELWIKVHKKNDGSYINDEARVIGERIEEIEQQDESSRWTDS
ncbi:uncharacterized protein LOC110268441 [Arachis ipaensis]|uniref:uncharacterized protein LOC110268441 n=1 Tax=Arachis ipaensis TaxID=130454 RepID=UPI000A2B61C8|nr:uncharacterized protein LOC110268441 [Arachis ipaensis]